MSNPRMCAPILVFDSFGVLQTATRAIGQMQGLGGAKCHGFMIEFLHQYERMRILGSAIIDKEMTSYGLRVDWGGCSHKLDLANGWVVWWPRKYGGAHRRVTLYHTKEPQLERSRRRSRNSNAWIRAAVAREPGFAFQAEARSEMLKSYGNLPWQMPRCAPI